LEGNGYRDEKLRRFTPPPNNGGDVVFVKEYSSDKKYLEDSCKEGKEGK